MNYGNQCVSNSAPASIPSVPKPSLMSELSDLNAELSSAIATWHRMTEALNPLFLAVPAPPNNGTAEARPNVCDAIVSIRGIKSDVTRLHGAIQEVLDLLQL